MLQLLGIDIDPYILNHTAAEIACKARPPGKLVIGSVGPSGKLLSPYGALTESEAISGFIPQIKGLMDGGVDAIVFETYMDLREMRCAITALKECGDIPFICSPTFELRGKRLATLMGDTPEKTLEFGISAGALAVGANCGVGIDQMIKIMASYRMVHPTIPLWAKPNAGMPELVDGKAVYTESPDYFAARLPELLQYNPSFIGGCCGTAPEHIERIRNQIKK
jgi:5-methyltetrahydrofolate--homocysteine methyltransferase